MIKVLFTPSLLISPNVGENNPLVKSCDGNFIQNEFEFDKLTKQITEKIEAYAKENFKEKYEESFENLKDIYDIVNESVEDHINEYNRFDFINKFLLEKDFVSLFELSTEQTRLIFELNNEEYEDYQVDKMESIVEQYITSIKEDSLDFKLLSSKHSLYLYLVSMKFMYFNLPFTTYIL